MKRPSRKSAKSAKVRPMAARTDAVPRRRVRVIGMVLVGAALVAGAAVAARHAARDAAASGTFRVAALEVRGLRLLTGDEILAASGVEVGSELFAVDLDGVAARVDSLVWVRSARVERKPPDRLVVHLQERRRVLWIEWQGRLHGLDADAVLLPPDRLATEQIADLDLPVLRVPSTVLTDSLVPGQAVGDSLVLRLVDWWTTARTVSPELAAEISQIEPLDDEALVLRLIADDLEVRLPYGQVSRRLAALREVLARVYGECPNPAYVDLRFDGQAVIGTAAASAPSPARRPSPSGHVVDDRNQDHG